MSFNEASWPASPKDTQYTTPNFFWPDRSWFCFDLPPRNVVDDWPEVAVNSVYDLPQLQTNSFEGFYNGWLQWMDKYQLDYRFGAYSDATAELNLYPEVQDPWMFTEYVFSGMGKDSYLDDAVAQDRGIVQPPFTDPLHVTREYQGDGATVPYTVKTSALVLLNDQRPTYMRQEHLVTYDLENQWQTDPDPLTGQVRVYWQSELEALGWRDKNSDGSSNVIFTRTSTTRRVVKYATPTINSGVRIYRHQVWSQSTRWGSSQNIPERTVNLTAPKEFMKPASLFTGKMVPQITIEWGVPLYDNIPDAQNGGQYVLRYEGYGATAFMKIGLFERSLTGTEGDPAATFAYALNPGNMNGALQVPCPKNNLATLIWNPAPFNNDDLIHRGCQFWVGQTGSCQCSYYQNNPTRFGVLWQTSISYTDPNAVIGLIDVDTFDPSQETLVLTFQSGSTTVDMTAAQKTVSYLLGDAGAVSQIQILQTSGSLPVYALKSLAEGGFLPASSSSGTLFIKRYVKDKPYPHATLCGSYFGSSITDSIAGYGGAGGKCPYYSPLGKRTLASYKAQAHNGAEWANLQNGLPDGSRKSPLDTAMGQSAMGMFGAGGGFGAGVIGGLAFAYAAAAPVPDPFSDQDISQDYQTVSVTFVPERTDVTGKSTYYATTDGQPSIQNPLNDLRITPGTGFHIMDDKDTQPYSGVDTPFFGFVNQINYRIARNVQHCYRSENCDPIITAPGGAPGWRRGRYSNIDFTSSPLRMPGYPGYDGTDMYCHTGDSRCPFNRSDRRAAEYDNNYQVLIQEILLPFRANGIDSFYNNGIQEALLNFDGTIKFVGTGATYPDPTTGQQSQYLNCIFVGVGPDTGSPPVIGHFQPKAKDQFGNTWRIYFYYDRPTWDPYHNLSRVSAHIVQFDDLNNPCYMDPPSDSGNIAAWQKLFNSEETAPWLVEIYDDYKSPTGYAAEVTNENPFAGGRAPEYKDRSKIGNTILCPWGGIVDNTYTEGVNSNQFGGMPWERAGVSGQLNRTYWVDEDGEWILDGPMIGVGEGFVEARPRMVSRPGVYGDCYPIDGIPGVEIQDPTGDNGGSSGSIEWASSGYVYSNDTSVFLDYLATIWDASLPPDPNNPDPSATITISPPDCNRAFLPRERKWWRCNVCGTDYPQEEVNFLKIQDVESRDFPVSAQTMFPIPDGTLPTDRITLYPIPEDLLGDCGCPRYDGGVLQYQGGYDRFMNTHARGNIDFWATPGSTVDHAGYFWKNPTLMNRMHQDQVFGKLGKYNTGNSGGYTLTGLSEDHEKMGRFPATTARNYQVGIAHQITAPWAMPGETVQTVRQRIGNPFSLRVSDNSYVQRGDVSTTQKVADETTFTLELGDIIHFIRDETAYGGTAYETIGLPIVVCGNASSIIMAETLIANDTGIPLQSSFTNDDQGKILFKSALRQWVIDVVYGSLQDWSSNVYMSVNALYDYLQSRGRNPDLSRQFDPRIGDPNYKDIDERIIDAYGSEEAGGLKMMTMDNLKRLRNRVLPMMAYKIPGVQYKAGGDYYDRIQSAFQSRFSDTDKPIPFPVYGTIPPQVMAANDNGIDYYVEWSVGDFTNETARAYYPVGTTWWRINQTVGAIKRNGGTNWFHLDQADGQGDTPYTGDNIVSTVTYFLHGQIPMDKEVERAFLIFTPNDAPTMDAIGCQGEYDGFVGAIGLYGEVLSATVAYVGNSYCFWQHYHGYKSNHEKAIPYNYWNRDARLHVLAGHPGGHVVIQDGDTALTFDNYFQSLGLTDDGGPNPFAEIQYAPQIVPESMEYAPFIAGGADALYTPFIGLLGMSFEDVGHGFGLTQPYFAPWSFGQDIEQIQTEYQVWKIWDTAEYQTYADRYHVHAQAAVNTYESVLSLEYYGSIFRNQHWTKHNQPIAGWLNFAGYDSQNAFQKQLNITMPTADTSWGSNGQIIVQAQSDSYSGTVSSSGSTNQTITGGGNGSQQAGSQPKVLNITDTIKRLYGERVDRYYKCSLGHSYSQLFALVTQRTDTNLGLNPSFHGTEEDPEFYWNYRYAFGNPSIQWGIWLTDPWHCPEMVNGEQVVADSDGDPISQVANDRFARVTDVSAWDQQGESTMESGGQIDLPGGSIFYQYHPFSLCNTDTPYFGPSSDKSINPEPLDDPTKYWRVQSSLPTANTFDMSLQQNPYENDRRNWRFQPGQIDSSQAVCPNIACIIHQYGWTVAQYVQMATTTWGLGVIPSTTSKYCANCGTELIGWVTDGGDGIITVKYDPQELPDALVNAVEANTDHETWLSDLHHGFSVEFWNTSVGNWRTLFTVEYDEVDNKFHWLEWNGMQWADTSSQTLPSVFKGCEGSNGSPKNPGIATGSHFIAIPAAKIRFKVTRPAVNALYAPNSDPTVWGSITSGSLGTNYIDLPASIFTDDLSLYPGRLISFKVSTLDGSQIQCNILSATANGDIGNTVRVWTSTQLIPSFDSYQIAWKTYITRCTKFRVYGYPYRTGDVLITSPGYVQPMFLGIGTNKYRLNTWPSQISSVVCSVGEGDQVPMSFSATGPYLTNGTVNPSFTWSVTQDIFAGQSFLRITQGQWFYDWRANQVVVPTNYIDPVTSVVTSIWSLNATIYANPNNPFPLKTLPSFLQLEYIVGCGMPCDVPITACGTGPSYQVEPECINYVVAENGNGSDMIGSIPAGFSSDSMPPIGNSVILEQLGQTSMPMMWQVYNHEAIVWPSTISWIVGDELLNTGGKGAWGDNQIWNYFTGNLGTNLSDLGSLQNDGVTFKGAASPIGGKAAGTVTLYGSANTILSGNLIVAAKAITQRTYNFADDPSNPVTTIERTGGLRCGFFTFRLQVNDVVSKKRTGITTAVPTILIYLHERRLTDPLES